MTNHFGVNALSRVLGLGRFQEPHLAVLLPPKALQRAVWLTPNHDDVHSAGTVLPEL